MVDQRLACRNYADGGYTAIYALRGDGRVYAWRTGDSAYESLLMVIFPAVCAPLGMILGLGFALLRNRRRTQAAAQ